MIKLFIRIYTICICMSHALYGQQVEGQHELAVKLLPIGLAYEWHGFKDLSLEMGFTSTRENISVPDPDEPLGISVFENGQRETHLFIAAKRYYLMDVRRSLHYGINLSARLEHNRSPEVQAYYRQLTNRELTNGYVYGPGFNLGYAHIIRQRIVAGLDVYSFLALNNNYSWEGILYHLRLGYRI